MAEELQEALLVEALVLDDFLEHAIEDPGLDADGPPNAGRVVEDHASAKASEPTPLSIPTRVARATTTAEWELGMPPARAR